VERLQAAGRYPARRPARRRCKQSLRPLTPWRRPPRDVPIIMYLQRQSKGVGGRQSDRRLGSVAAGLKMSRGGHNSKFGSLT
jgi:hypothetical protein